MTQSLVKNKGYRVFATREKKERARRTIYPLASEELIIPFNNSRRSINNTPRGKKLVDDTRLSFIKVLNPETERTLDQ